MSTPDEMKALDRIRDAIERVPKLGGAGAIYEAELLSVLRDAEAALEAATTPMPDERLDAIEMKARAAAKHGRDGYFVVDLIEIAELLPTLIAEVRRLRALSAHPAEETVTTVEELDALPVGSLVLADGEVYQRITPNSRVNSGRETWRCLHEAKGYREWETYVALVVMAQEFRDGQGIARVLFRPTPEGSGS